MAGRCFATLCNALRIVLASKAIGLEVNASKCCVMAPSRYKAAMDKLLRPLRRGEVGCWRVVKSITILGVALSDPTNKEELQKAVRKALKERVVCPAERLSNELREGAKKSTALWVLRRWILPGLDYHARMWGLHVDPDVWREVDDALDCLCRQLCAPGQRACLEGDVTTEERLEGRGPPFRRELALPQSCGGLGIPIMTAEAPHRAAAQWKCKDACASGAMSDLLRRAYVTATGVLACGEKEPLGLDAYHKTVAAGLREAVNTAARRAWDRRRQSCLEECSPSTRCLGWRT